MAPALTSNDTASDVTVTKSHVSRNIFPDGIKTSGQHPPIYEELRAYEDFPESIDGPTLWKSEDYRENPERWIHPFSQEEIEEISIAADNFRAAGIPLTGDNFPLPRLSSFLASIRNELLNGKGFILFKGFPVEAWGNQKSAIAYMGLGTYLGYFVSQNGKGHVLGHVKDLGEDAKRIDKVRIYRTNARQYFHADPSDIVGLLCIARALEGGESDITSVHNVYNTLRAERPDVLKTLTEPNWYFDRKGEVSRGEEPYIRDSVFYLEPKEGGRVYCKWDPYYVRSLERFSSKGIIPPLSPAQIEAADVLEATCKRLSLHMILEIGDIQFVSNAQVLHARTAYTDHAPPAPRRHLMRLWLATPESEGGWCLPFHDRDEKKRGGIQVDDTPPVAHLDAD
ncbi:MAG: hypothetical protein HETSPECPRED_004977 [Heterodermia speciosa]|uniref:TauD/TfdA-like domain-containing protein n=1 Tax=Heterodermia speciosa TaxID=116794 RepID=A0A8H3EDZ6_9LECA|nr:MAG: hypothetical protein HETSPECPRED_004977 [Heterodermia speciosa]